jgi:hypothetical protein
MIKKEDKKDYIIAVYTQASENARLHSESRFRNLSSFLTYVSILIAALTFLFTGNISAVLFPLLGTTISVMGIIASLFFIAIDVRHHDYWEYYEGTVVKKLEEEMGVGQYPLKSNFSKRPWFGKGFLGFVTASRAVYGVYISSMIFFIVMLYLFLK